MLDDFSELEIVGSEAAQISDDYAYFSLLNITGKARGITIQNAAYNLENAEITTEYQYGVSNEPLKNKIATVQVDDGELLLIKVWK